MAKTFMQMVGEAQQAVPAVSPEEARRRIDADPNTLVIDVRDESSIRASGTVPGAAAISAGALLYRSFVDLGKGADQWATTSLWFA